VSTKKVGKFKVFYREGTSDDIVVKNGFGKSDIFKHAPEYRNKKTDTIVVIGAHIGSAVLFAASKVSKGKVYAIEPSKNSFNILKKNVKLNKFKNIQLDKLAISDKNGSTQLSHDTSDRLGHSTTHDFGLSSELVKTESLENFLLKRKINKCNFLLINCEGAEFVIASSTPKSVFKKIDNMLIQYHLHRVKGYNLDDLVKTLKSKGFEIRTRRYNNVAGWVIATRR